MDCTSFHWIFYYTAVVSLLLFVAKYLRFFVIPSPLRDIPGPSPGSWFKGNLGQLFNRKGLRFHHDLVERYGGVVKVHGFFGDEQLYISDPRALQSIIQKDQDAFEETRVFTETNKIIFGEGLVATTGEHHKRQRKIVNPIFSSKNLRNLAPVFYEIAHRLIDALSNDITTGASDPEPKPVDMSAWMSRVALETVGLTVIGHSFDPLDTPTSNPYTKAVRDMIPTLFSLSLVRQFAPFLVRLGPAAFRRKLVDLTPIKAVQKVKDMSDVMYNTARTILRQKSGASEDDAMSVAVPPGRDLLQILVKENSKALGGEKLSEAEIIGQMTVLIFGAQDTTSSALSRILYMLSINTEIQTKLREEIRSASIEHNGEDLDYDVLLSLPWLDAVIKESLRLYPPVPFVRRTATKTRTIPLWQPIHPGSSYESGDAIVIPEGTTLFLGLAAANRSEAIWGKDAKQWKPERWMSGGQLLPSSDKMSDVPRLPGIYANGMLTFLGGERACIGYKFAQVEMKIILATLLSNFVFSPTLDKIVWNLSQIISPSVQTIISPVGPDGNGRLEEHPGLPIVVRPVADI